MRKAGEEASKAAKGLIRSSPGGPGNAPKNRTGRLIRSFKIKTSKSGLGVNIKATAEPVRGQGRYGLYLEAGVQYQTSPVNRPKRVHRKRNAVIVARVGHTTIMPRPFLSTALDQARAGLQSRIGAAVQQGVEFKKQK